MPPSVPFLIYVESTRELLNPTSGFTVSLFITGLVFGSGEYAEQAKIGILTASLVAATIGSLLLYFADGRRGKEGTT